VSDIDYKQLAKEWLAEINNHNVDVFDTHLATNFVEHELVPGIEGTGKEVPKTFFSMLFNAFPDFRMDMEDIIVEGDKVCWRHRMTGRNTGEFMGMPPTGKSIDINGFDMLRMVDDKAAEHWGVNDGLKMMQQLGLVPEPPSA
jgi:predicted ester cyclase